MDLWIRTQKNNSLMQVNNVYIYKNKIKTKTRCLGSILGKYKTKERALEVLDEIQTLLMQQQLLVFKNADITADELEAIKRVGAVAIQEGQKESEVKYISPSSFVYQMPKE